MKQSLKPDAEYSVLVTWVMGFLLVCCVALFSILVAIGNLGMKTDATTAIALSTPQRVVTDRLLLQVNGAWTVDTLSYSTPRPGNSFLVIDVTLQNNGPDKFGYNPAAFTAKDEQSIEYHALGSAPFPSLWLGTLRPGDSVRGNVAFEIPTTAKVFRVSYQLYDEIFPTSGGIIVKVE